MTLRAFCVSLFVLGSALVALAQNPTGNVIFIHPDGTGVNTYGALRLWSKGPDGRLNWDRLERMGVYVGTMSDALAASSNGGGTAHAYGVRPTRAAFGIDRGEQLLSASGAPYSIMREAQKAGIATGIISSATMTDAGTGIFLASTPSRRDYHEIARQMIESQPELLLGGGEEYLLPKGVQGRHGEGTREDNLNLVERAKALGYTIVYTKEELAALPSNTERVLGLFAANTTFNDQTEENLAEAKLPLFVETAPSVAEMMAFASRFFEEKKRQFFLVLEEEATDNFGGENNALGVLTALQRADDAIGHALELQSRLPNTLILTASDSDCGGLQVFGGTASSMNVNDPVPATDENGAPRDGDKGTGTAYFYSAPDKDGNRLPFAIQWASAGDVSGGIVARAHGFGADKLPLVVRNFEIYNVMYEVLFGRTPAQAKALRS